MTTLHVQINRRCGQGLGRTISGPEEAGAGTQGHVPHLSRSTVLPLPLAPHNLLLFYVFSVFQGVPGQFSMSF